MLSLKEVTEFTDDYLQKGRNVFSDYTDVSVGCGELSSPIPDWEGADAVVTTLPRSLDVVV